MGHGTLRVSGESYLSHFNKYKPMLLKTCCEQPYKCIYFWKGKDLSFPEIYTFVRPIPMHFKLHCCISV